MDGNDLIFPIAFGVGHFENDRCWTWFLTEFCNVIGVPRDMIIISDRHISIKNVIAFVFPEAAHGLCGFHMKNNVSITYKNPDMTTLFVKASKVYRTDEFTELMEELSIVKPKVYEKLMDDDVRNWSRAYCPIRRYDLMTTNIAESMNSSLRHARKLPITPLMKSIRAMLQKWFHNRRISAEMTATPLTG